jgi:hypothetical protein
MSIKTETAKRNLIWGENYEAAVDLSNLQFCAVAASGGSSGKMKIGKPSSQGVWTIGILEDDSVTAGKEGHVMRLGRTKAYALQAFNSGIELTAYDATGKLHAAASGDYVIAISVDASSGNGALIAVDVVSPYQKN